MRGSGLLQELPVRHKNEPCCSLIAAPSMSETQISTIADRFKAMSDPTRLRMLDLIAQQSDPLCVCDITDQFPLSQPTISHHLKLLRDAGLIQTEKRGLWSYYWVTDAGRSALSAAQTLK